MCYWSASNTEGHRILQYEAGAKAIERKVRALVCIESDKGESFEERAVQLENCKLSKVMAA